MDCALVSTLPEGSDWTYEVKLDGYRAIGVRTNRETILYSRNHKNFNKRFPQIADALGVFSRHSRNSSLKPSGLCLPPLKSCGFSGACYNPLHYRKGARLANLNLVGFTAEVTLQALRTRLQKMTDQQLLRFGQTARYMCSSGANLGEPPREIFVVQLHEVRTEWQRRNPELPPSVSLGGTGRGT